MVKPALELGTVREDRRRYKIVVVINFFFHVIIEIPLGKDWPYLPSSTGCGKVFNDV